ncbi:MULTISPECIES: inhibitor of vertebrate lysozyme family protein [unclassified Pseudomonas]|uniref:inhibitor of vertebrate lysozyme family protein n=1 Tax=unclassified Pseudomonas TaxID=196821 RepID=UPI0019117FA9|nr:MULTISPECIES: inhibitor of vertebrate lysozyme family protein [unclassified Pseudomonas]MBK5509499.1 inhibitor of vertebrate lysozyme family protein [Pseudomonas sp. TH15]MBK5551657.1 inhibitor of vertebrate lysozyme family protein [Pseudomonas sp. TH03]MEB0222734.1 inhibitor of vertebrate lysozyme family protein [Pseudomonas sp. 5S1]MEB0292899.1 inhibitor of vertebrate lysozyme family protein [Pseudomonas sp. 10S4]WPX19987.1 inhibitor of vertebrate lysozyme family protein [Pseudomonas sp. 
MSVLLKTLAAALLLGGGAMAMAANNDGQARANELLNSDPQYRDTWTKVVKKEERLPEWVMNLSGASEQMNAVEENGGKYLVGPLCETQQTCLNKRLIVAFSFNKKDAYAMLVEVPAGLPADKSPTRHADYRFLGKPNQGMQDLLMEQLKKDPNWY